MPGRSFCVVAAADIHRALGLEIPHARRIEKPTYIGMYEPADRLDQCVRKQRQSRDLPAVGSSCQPASTTVGSTAMGGGGGSMSRA